MILLRLTMLAYALSLCTVSLAQGLRVSTVVRDAARLDSNYDEPIVSSSFSLFHHGRVYDYVDAAGEVVVFEPNAKKFTIINPNRKVFTTVTFDEVRRLLDARGPRTEAYLKELREKNSPEADRAMRILTFQLHPQFEESFNPKNGLLTMTADSWKYTVSTSEWDDEDQLQQYIAFTDWLARLNYVLHPTSMFPEPRLKLNQQLRELKSRVPVFVKLDLRPNERLVLRAEHNFDRNLTDRDRQLITSWDKAVKSNEFTEVPFLSYQKSILISQRR